MKNKIQILCLLTIVTSALSQIDYATQVQPIFNAACTNCHGTTSGVKLSSYADVISSIGTQYTISIVVAGNKEVSPLWDKINSSPAIGKVMPINSTLDEDNRTIIGQWIDEGALEAVTAIDDHKDQPFRFQLISCYPNPFNPMTTVHFSVPSSAMVTLRIFDLKGRIVHHHSGFYEIGDQSIPIQLNQKTSGVYLVQLHAVIQNQILFSKAMKIMLMK